MTTRARSTIVASLAVLAALAATAGPGAGVSVAQPQRCGPQGDYQINIGFGDISCSDAYAIAAAYNLTGEKYQDIGTSSATPPTRRLSR